MGKRQHQKDKMYLTCTEWTTLYGGKHAGFSNSKDEFKRLPFDHCSLSLQPFEHPLCSPEGHVFDLMNIVPFLKKFGVNPINGTKLDAKSLIKLNFHKNSEGKYHCPVMYKVFNDSSHIVAIKTTGNVFSFEAVEQLNLKAKSLKDLLTDEPFQRNDIVTLQDPANLEKFNLAEFHHLRNNMKVEDEEFEKAKKDPTYFLKSVSSETKDILDELNKEYKPKEKGESVDKRTADRFNAAHYSTGAVAASFTSTIMEPATKHEAAILDEEIVRYGRVKKKGYVRLMTNLGPLNLELHCDMVPKTCENFMKLCSKGYYDNTVFHRSIRNFMIQGGDPLGTGKGGESYWGRPFKDEFKPNLSHSGRGILSMANSGPNANKSQFFITYRSCKHLDGKHAIFGRLVGGHETLNLMEKVPTDGKDKPTEEIKILSGEVFVDPFQEADDALAEDRKIEKEAATKESVAAKPVSSAASQEIRLYKKGVGKYINPNLVSSSSVSDVPSKKRKMPEGSGSFGDFSSW